MKITRLEFFKVCARMFTALGAAILATFKG